MTKVDQKKTILYNIDEKYHDLIKPVIDNPLFWDTPASINHHHTEDGGLARHTLEILKILDNMCCDSHLHDLDTNLVFIAAVWHDYGKIYDYKKEDDNWKNTDHKSKIHHISRSYAEFINNVNHLKLQGKKYPQEFIDSIGHCILAHHGRQEWGSPVEPQTIEAYILHAADMISARYIGWEL